MHSGSNIIIKLKHLLFLVMVLLSSYSFQMKNPDESFCVDIQKNTVKDLYETLNLKDKLNYQAFEYAYFGYQVLESKCKKNLLTIIDYSLSSSEKRLFLVDLKEERLVYHTYVAHGKNTGLDTAKYFSNTLDSKQTSLGFFITGKTYYGKNGYSLKLIGMESGINDLAEERAIVIHGANYVSKNFISQHGRLGRSWGCPALPSELNQEIIDLIKNGSLVFSYSDRTKYAQSSPILGKAILVNT